LTYGLARKPGNWTHVVQNLNFLRPQQDAWHARPWHMSTYNPAALSSSHAPSALLTG
jgi:hypothetical protein